MSVDCDAWFWRLKLKIVDFDFEFESESVLERVKERVVLVVVVDHFYIVLFSVLKQTHCARM